MITLPLFLYLGTHPPSLMILAAAITFECECLCEREVQFDGEGRGGGERDMQVNTTYYLCNTQYSSRVFARGISPRSGGGNQAGQGVTEWMNADE